MDTFADAMRSLKSKIDMARIVNWTSADIDGLYVYSHGGAEVWVNYRVGVWSKFIVTSNCMGKEVTRDFNEAEDAKNYALVRLEELENAHEEAFEQASANAEVAEGK